MLMGLIVGSIALHPVMTQWAEYTLGTAVKYIWAPPLGSEAYDIRRGYVDLSNDVPLAAVRMMQGTIISPSGDGLLRCASLVTCTWKRTALRPSQASKRTSFSVPGTSLQARFPSLNPDLLCTRCLVTPMVKLQPSTEQCFPVNGLNNYQRRL